MSVGATLKALMRQKKISAVEVADKLGVSDSAVRHWANSRRIPDANVVSQLASILGVSADVLIGSSKMAIETVKIVGTASCGSSDINHLQEDGQSALFRGDRWHKDLYCVIASGDSMSPEIDDGDEVICDPTITAIHGDIVHYIIHNESAIKVLAEDKEAHIIQLVPYNPTPDFKIRTVRLDDEEAKDLKLRKVIAVNKLKTNNRLARLRLIGRV